MALKMIFIPIDGKIIRACIGHRTQLYAMKFYNEQMHGKEGKIALNDKRLSGRFTFGVGYYYELKQDVVTNAEMELALDDGWEIIQ